MVVLLNEKCSRCWLAGRCGFGNPLPDNTPEIGVCRGHEGISGIPVRAELALPNWLAQSGLI
jgi:hypothetical protein